MKYLPLILLPFLIWGCKKSETTNLEKSEFDWLEGRWLKINDSAETVTYEVWNSISSIQYRGHGFILQKKDTIWQEKMNLFKNDTIWTLSISTPENGDEVSFAIKSISDTAFIAQNQEHDFPNFIEYWYSNTFLHAKVRDKLDSLMLDFKFKPIK